MTRHDETRARTEEAKEEAEHELAVAVRVPDVGAPRLRKRRVRKGFREHPARERVLVHARLRRRSDDALDVSRDAGAATVEVRVDDEHRPRA